MEITPFITCFFFLSSKPTAESHVKFEHLHLHFYGNTVSQRGVVFLRDQDVIPTEMKDFMIRLTQLAGSVSFYSTYATC